MGQPTLTFSPISDNGEIVEITELNSTDCQMRTNSDTHGVCGVITVSVGGDISLTVRSETGQKLTIILLPIVSFVLSESPTDESVVFASSATERLSTETKIESDTYMLIIRQSDGLCDDPLELYVDFEYSPHTSKSVSA